MVIFLPCEIHELIIDELRYCFAGLKSCSLVCKAWLPRCRLHLFRVIPIRVGPRRVVRERCSTSPFFRCYNRCSQQSIPHTSPLPPISCVCGLRIFYESIPSQNATQTSSVSLVPSALMLPSISSWSFITPLSSFKGIRFLHIHWKAINWLHDPGHVAGAGTALEKILQRIDCLEHLVIESRWRFSVKEDILRSLAVYAPNLRTLSLLKLRWFPLFTPPVIENILGMWNVRFNDTRVPPLRLERLCIRDQHLVRRRKSGVADLVNVVILPSPCLDLSNLRYLAMSASSLRGALDDGQFPDLGKRVTYLTIMDLDGPAFHLHDYFPNISHLQLFVSNDGVLLQLLPSIRLDSHLVHLHVNFEPSYPDILQHDFSGSTVDSLLRELMQRSKKSQIGRGIYVSMHFAQAEAYGSDIQRRCIQKAFPQSCTVGSVAWADRRSLEWWLNCE